MVLVTSYYSLFDNFLSFFYLIIGVPGPEFRLKDKVLHSIEFFILSFLFFRAFSNYNIKGSYYFAIIFGSLYGALDEVHQLFVPGRFFSFFDMIADGIGTLFIFIFKIFEIKTKKISSIRIFLKKLSIIN